MDGSSAGTVDSDILRLSIDRRSAWRLLDSLRTVVTDNAFVGAPGCNAGPRVYRCPEVRVVILVGVAVAEKPIAGGEVCIRRSKADRISRSWDSLWADIGGSIAQLLATAVQRFAGEYRGKPAMGGRHLE